MLLYISRNCVFGLGNNLFYFVNHFFFFFSGKPFFFRKKYKRWFTDNGEDTTINIYVYSYPKLQTIHVFNERGHAIMHGTYETFHETIITDNIYGNEINVSVYKIDVKISRIEIANSQNFIVNVSNNKGSTSYVETVDFTCEFVILVNMQYVITQLSNHHMKIKR